ncbi:MAG: hypothetical protein ABR924_05090 [Terracidiphilus sp.]|jgi:uncharacterized membrane protein (UPF0127 family)
MESQKLCAYNQTRECFLGLEVTAADLSYSNVKTRMASLSFKSGEGLWLVPFRAMPESGMHVPFDLIYLDEDCRVIDLVESFPTFTASSSGPKPASVLVLPTHSVYSSQTQFGDQLVICAAEEMERRLEKFSGSGGVAGAVRSAALLRQAPLWSGGPGLLQLENRSGEGPGSQQTHEMELILPGMKEARPPRSWLERWWSPDPRKAPRELGQGLAAYYWTGAAPEAHEVKDISSSGLYLITEERWYPGTLILMTLTRTDRGEECAERSISVHSRAVRWGNDGVGLQFVLANEQEKRLGRHVPVVDGLDKRDLERFLRLFQNGRC